MSKKQAVPESGANEFHVWTVWHPMPASVAASGTYKKHHDIIDKYSEVYWGIISKRVYTGGHPFDDDIGIVNEQIRAGTKTLLYVKPRDDEERAILGVIKEIRTNLPDWEDLKTVPTYYREVISNDPSYRIPYWFLLSKIEYVDQNSMREVRILADFDTRKHGSSGYPYPCLCKRIDFEDERGIRILKWNDIKIEFVNEETVAIEIKGVSLKNKHYHFETLNFHDRRKKVSSQYVRAWKILLLSAAGQGSIPFGYALELLKSTDVNFKKAIENTNKLLRKSILSLLGNHYKIDGRLFIYDHGQASYKIQLNIQMNQTMYQWVNKDARAGVSEDIQQIFRDAQRGINAHTIKNMKPSDEALEE